MQLPAVELVYVARDERGKWATPSIHLQPQEFSTATAKAVAVLSRVQAVSGASIESYNLIYRYHVSDDPAPAADLVNQVAVFLFECQGVEQYLYLEVPAIRAQYIETEAPYVKIDTQAPNIAAFVQNIISSNFCNPFGYQVVQLLDAYVSFQP